jgi:rare lipoprotein A
MVSASVRAYFAVAMIAIFGAASCGKRHARVAKPNPPTAVAKVGDEETGIASWYGVPYHGRRTASGEVYDMEKMTAAHRRLPFQTWVEVTNLENGKRVDVRITDRGPFIDGRIIDLSHKAADQIAMLGPGIVKVRLRVIPPPPSEPQKDLPVEDAPQKEVPQNEFPGEGPAEATPARSDAEAPQPRPAVYRPDLLKDSAKPVPSVVPSNTSGFAVQAGAFSDRARAESLRARITGHDSGLYKDVRVVLGSNQLWRVVVGRHLGEQEATALAARLRKEFGDSLVVSERAVQDPE